MNDWIRLVGPNQAVELFGVKLVGFNAENGKKLLFSIALVLVAMLVGKLLRRVMRNIPGDLRAQRVRFWLRQAVNILIGLITVLGVLSIWFDDPTRLATFAGLVTAGVAFALQRVITALAGYFLILRGNTFNVGDRITMGGVRGDVIALSFLQTTIMEMGQPPPVQNADPAQWVKARQYSGRVVTVTNDKVFDQPVFNYTRKFPYIWEEMTLPVAYRDERHRAERILLDAARRHTEDISRISEEDLQEIERRFVVRRSDVHPRVYWRMTDNWLELTVRFITKEAGVRDLKDAMTREILGELDKAGIGIASATFEVVGLPPLRLERAHAERPPEGSGNGSHRHEQQA